MARADRIDLLAEGSLRVIDYKTGNPPSRTAVTEARALQLRVEAVLAAAGPSLMLRLGMRSTALNTGS